MGYKLVLSCEGEMECQILEDLLDCNLLRFDREDLLDEKPIHFRQPEKISHIINLLPPKTNLYFIRVGDTLTDEFDYTCIKSRLDYIKEYKVCTKPEIEILGIINENKLNDFNKSRINAKEFFKGLGLGSFKDYAKKHSLVEAMKYYKHLKTHEKNIYYLADLLKK